MHVAEPWNTPSRLTSREDLVTVRSLAKIAEQVFGQRIAAELCPMFAANYRVVNLDASHW
jgi:hypothetical protein